MNTREHYLMYRNLVRKDSNQFSWDEQEDFLAPVRNMKGWIQTTKEGEKLMTEVTNKVAIMAESAGSGDEYAYREAAESHQMAALEMLDSYVKYYIKPWRSAYRESRGPLTGMTVDEAFLAEKGMGWFKFFDKIIEAKLTVGETTVDHIIVPRYSPKFCKNLEGKFYFDTDEVVIAKGLSKEHFKQVQEIKARSVLYKIFLGNNGEITSKPIKTFNVPSVVRDWTLDLFPL